MAWSKQNNGQKNHNREISTEKTMCHSKRTRSIGGIPLETPSYFPQFKEIIKQMVQTRKVEFLVFYPFNESIDPDCIAYFLMAFQY